MHIIDRMDEIIENSSFMDKFDKFIDKADEWYQRTDTKISEALCKICEPLYKESHKVRLSTKLKKIRIRRKH